jgi:hypothetical protein
MPSRLLIFICFLVPPISSLTQNVEPDVFYKSGSTQKISQLVGDYDNQWQQPTKNQTNTNYGLWGTDLGVPFAHNGKTYVLFGDVPGTDRDPIAYTDDADPEDGISLRFISNPDGSYKPIDIPGIAQGAFEVPSEGVSIDGVMYVFHTTDNMSRSVLAKSMDNGHSFSLVNPDFSSDHFINLSVEKIQVSDWSGLPDDSGQGLVIFGSGKYRESNVYLAFQPANGIEDEESLQFFSGMDASQNPLWSSREPEASALFSQTCVGEFSVNYNPYIKKWILLYNCDKTPHPRGILFRTADLPWGPWSNAQLLFDPWADHGYCHFMHVSWDWDNCDNVHDPGRAFEWGGEYGPYQFGNLATGTDTTTTIYYTLSTWNPYTVVLMKSTLFKPVKTGIMTQNGKEDIEVFPNPFQTSINLRFDPDHNTSSIIVFNALGKRILNKSVKSEEVQIKTGHWEKGIYYLRVVSENGNVVTKKLIRH